MSSAQPTTPSKRSCRRTTRHDEDDTEKHARGAAQTAGFDLPPTPDTSKRCRVVNIGPKGKIRSVGQRLKAEADDSTTLAPSTPKLNIITDEMVKNWNAVAHEESSAEEEITREHLDNPFAVAAKEFNPFDIANEADSRSSGAAESEVDYERYNEFITKSGRRVVKKLTPSQKAIKPRRLFTKINDKYVAKRLNKLVLSGEFEIFKDDD